MQRNFIEELGSLSLSTRLKNLSDRLAKDVGRIYKEQDFDFEPRWFAMIYALKNHKELAVTEMASMLQQTHPAVNQVANVLVSKELVKEFKDENDQRKRMLSLTKKGKNLVSKMESLWEKIRLANDDLLTSTDPNFLQTLKTLELALDEKSIYDRVKDQMK